MKWPNLLLYFHTIKYLKLKQIYFQVYYIVKHKVKRPILILISKNCAQLLERRGDFFVAIDPVVSQTSRPWSFPRVLLSHLSDTGVFSFHGEVDQLDNISIWNSSEHSKLWLYNVHYFDELQRLGSESRYEILYRYIQVWIEDNPPGIGHGWEPYPISLRIVNWVKWFSSCKPEPQWLKSLVIQADSLLQKIEYHLFGNHLIANAKALIFVGIYFTGKRADKWLRKGLDLLDREIIEQFLPDGAHFELSPMYHATMLWDVCDLIRLAELSNHPELLTRKVSWEAIIERGLDWLSCMVHPDGDISFFNDAALDTAPTLADITDYAKLLEISPILESLPEEASFFSARLLKNSGYFVANLENRSKAIVDVSKIGPDYQPGHAHADTLSFELSVHGHRFIVNSGTSQYGEDVQRQYERSTKAHSTVCLDGKNSSEVWAGFRVARRAYPRDLSVSVDKDKLCIVGAHDGYKYLPGRNIHKREWTFLKSSMMIRDKVVGNYSTAEARFYIHPDVYMIQHEGQKISFRMPNGQEVWVCFDGSKDVYIEPSHWYQYFGGTIKNICLVATFSENELETTITW